MFATPVASITLKGASNGTERAFRHSPYRNVRGEAGIAGWLGMFLVQSKQYLCALLTGLYGLCAGVEAVAEVPSLLVKIRVVPWKDCKPSVTQHAKVVSACAWQPALWGGSFRLLLGMALSL